MSSQCCVVWRWETVSNCTMRVLFFPSCARVPGTRHPAFLVCTLFSNILLWKISSIQKDWNNCTVNTDILTFWNLQWTFCNLCFITNLSPFPFTHQSFWIHPPICPSSLSPSTHPSFLMYFEAHECEPGSNDTLFPSSFSLTAIDLAVHTLTYTHTHTPTCETHIHTTHTILPCSLIQACPLLIDMNLHIEISHIITCARAHTHTVPPCAFVADFWYLWRKHPETFQTCNPWRVPYLWQVSGGPQ